MRYAVSSGVVAALLLGAAWGAGGASATTAPPDPASVTTAPSDPGSTTAPPDDETATTQEAPTPTSPADVRPRVAAFQAPLGAVAAAPVPDGDRLNDQIAEQLDDSWLGPGNRRSIAVRDALTGEPLTDRNSDRPMIPASTSKLLAAAAIVTGLDAETTFTTRVVAGEEPGQVVIVAGGDMLLGDGESDPEGVAGHAGIADLAAQTAVALRGSATDASEDTGGDGDGPPSTADEDASATTADEDAGAAEPEPVTVALDLSHVQGPHAMPTWSQHWVDEGWTGRIVQLGRARDRALPYNPSPREPEQEVARVFREALAAEGVEVVGVNGNDDENDDGENGNGSDEDEEQVVAEEVIAPEDAKELAAVESAALRDVLALALATSDNAMLEQLARQAAVAAGGSAEQDAVTAWIRDTMVEEYGLDMTGMRIADASGLSDGTRLSMQVVADVLVAGADGSHPDLQEVLAGGGLPIAGYTGTLGNGMRFHLPEHAPAVGNARAKTGTLPGVAALAGTVVTADGRLLVFAVAADDIDTGTAAIEAASVLDEIAAQLARCGC